MGNYSKLIVYHWPDSQICSGCQFGNFIQNEELDTSDYACSINCEDNNGINCPEFIQGEEDDNNRS